jgi:hypothetical protein
MREGKRRRISALYLNFLMGKEHYQKRKFHCRPVDNPIAMHHSMKITIRSSVRSFPTSRTILVDSFVWLCCTRRHKHCTNNYSRISVVYGIESDLCKRRTQTESQDYGALECDAF